MTVLPCPDGWHRWPSVSYAHCLICNGYSPPAWGDERLKPVRHKRWCWLKKAWRALIRAPKPSFDHWFLPSDKGEDPMDDTATFIASAKLEQKYQGTKQLLAASMTKERYCSYRGWEVPANEDPAELGYLVEYLDGGKANDPRHEGYISWSPADVFEKAYRPCGSHVDRMRIELDELEDRIAKLRTFTQGDVFAVLEDIDKLLMENQLSSMTTYQQALALRLHRATANQEPAQDGSGKPALSVGEAVQS